MRKGIFVLTKLLDYCFFDIEIMFLIVNTLKVILFLFFNIKILIIFC